MRKVLQLTLQTMLLSTIKCYKLPYIGHILTYVKRKINRSCEFHCKSLSIKIVLTPSLT